MPYSLAFSLAQKLVTINTVNPPGNETDAVRFLAPLLKEAGFSIKEYQYGPNRSSLVARKGKTDLPAVVLSVSFVFDIDGPYLNVSFFMI